MLDARRPSELLGVVVGAVLGVFLVYRLWSFQLMCKKLKRERETCWSTSDDEMNHNKTLTADMFPWLAQKRCLVTGGSGFLGKHVVQSLIELGCKVYVFDLAPPPASLSSEVEYIQGNLCHEPDVERTGRRRTAAPEFA